MASMTHDELRELTGGYALGVLSEPERLALETHLRTCSECASEVRGFLDVSSALAYAVPQQDPPPALRERVLRAVEAERDPHHRVVALKPRSRWWMPEWLAVAASIAAVAFGLYSVTLRQRIQDLQDRLQAANQRIVTAEQARAAARSAADEAERRNALATADDVRLIVLAGQKGAPSASGLALWSASRGLMVKASHLPPPPPGRQYQLWVIPPGSKTPISAGLLNLDPTGQAIVIADAAASANVGTVAVTDEPLGGVPQPTGAMALAGSVQ
jgi:anti-sigma-K factor RskA